MVTKKLFSELRSLINNLLDPAGPWVDPEYGKRWPRKAIKLSKNVAGITVYDLARRAVYSARYVALVVSRQKRNTRTPATRSPKVTEKELAGNNGALRSLDILRQDIVPGRLNQ